VKLRTYLLLLPLLLFFSCRKEKATWDSDWVAPLVSDTLSLKDYVNDSTIIENGGVYNLDLTRTIADFGIEDLIEIPDTTISQTYSIVVSSLSIPPGTSIVNQIEEHTFDLAPIELKKIRVSQGTIKLKIYNPLASKVYFTVQLPGVTQGGITFEQNYFAPAAVGSSPGTVEANLNISGYDIDLTGITGGEVNVLQSKLIINTDPLGSNVTVTNQHVFKVDADFKNMKIDYAKGYFGNKVFTDTSTYSIDLLNGLTAGSIDIPSSGIQLIITNGMKVEGRATLTKLANTNTFGSTVNLSSSLIGNPIYMDAATGNAWSYVPSTQTISLDAINSNLESYIENLGNKHTVGYKVELNPWGNTSGGFNEIYSTSRLKVKLKAQLPMAIGADGLTLRDTFDFDISQDIEKSHIESGILVLHASNAFPMNSSVKIYLLDENGATMHIVNGSGPIESSLYGSVDPNDNMFKMNSEVNFVLPENVLVDLGNIRNIAVEATFNTPTPATSLNQQQAIPAGAFIAVKLKTKFVFKAII
jgi:hypothetical protein